jgi:hypothetical protein
MLSVELTGKENLYISALILSRVAETNGDMGAFMDAQAVLEDVEHDGPVHVGLSNKMLKAMRKGTV